MNTAGVLEIFTPISRLLLCVPRCSPWGSSPRARGARTIPRHRHLRPGPSGVVRSGLCGRTIVRPMAGPLAGHCPDNDGAVYGPMAGHIGCRTAGHWPARYAESARRYTRTAHAPRAACVIRFFGRMLLRPCPFLPPADAQAPERSAAALFCVFCSVCLCCCSLFCRLWTLRVGLLPRPVSDPASPASRLRP